MRVRKTRQLFDSRKQERLTQDTKLASYDREGNSGTASERSEYVKKADKNIKPLLPSLEILEFGHQTRGMCGLQRNLTATGSPQISFLFFLITSVLLLHVGTDCQLKLWAL